MLFHLPIALLAALSPIPVSDKLPKFDISKECQFEGGSTSILERCSHDEAVALQQLRAEWPQFAGSDRSACLAEATAAGFGSYVELQICLELASDVSKKTTPQGSLAKVDSQLTRPERPQMRAGDQNDPIALRSDH